MRYRVPNYFFEPLNVPVARTPFPVQSSPVNAPEIELPVMVPEKLTPVPGAEKETLEDVPLIAPRIPKLALQVPESTPLLSVTVASQVPG